MSDTDTYDLVGAAEAADILGIGTPNFSHLRAKEEEKGEESTFPQPVVKLRCGPIWKRTDMVAYAENYGSKKKRVNGEVPAVASAPKMRVTRKRLTPPSQ